MLRVSAWWTSSYRHKSLRIDTASDLVLRVVAAASPLPPLLLSNICLKAAFALRLRCWVRTNSESSWCFLAHHFRMRTHMARSPFIARSMRAVVDPSNLVPPLLPGPRGWCDTKLSPLSLVVLANAFILRLEDDLINRIRGSAAACSPSSPPPPPPAPPPPPLLPLLPTATESGPPPPSPPLALPPSLRETVPSVASTTGWPWLPPESRSPATDRKRSRSNTMMPPSICDRCPPPFPPTICPGAGLRLRLLAMPHGTTDAATEPAADAAAEPAADATAE
mmetsp:Transcript_63346/g.174260  ORF Transcript_63346/g.174260 Transcript_63346/m.174260 type:complete len:279 (-) Transcript_63346:35-871(-)